MALVAANVQLKARLLTKGKLRPHDMVRNKLPDGAGLLEELPRRARSGADEGDEAAEALRTAQAACNVPLQLGVGVKGGAEILIASIRLALEQKPHWALFSDDKKNGYNALSREAMLRGVRRWFPSLLPTVRQFYARDGGLYTRERPRTSAAVSR